jgi:hypothetical protein
MSTALFDRLDATLRSEGPAAAIDGLCRQLRDSREYGALFYALLMKRRFELGVLPVPTGPASDLPEAVHPAYEEAIRSAAREVGGLYLKAGNIPHAWPFFRMIDEPQPVRAALESHRPGPDEDIQPLVQIAFYEGVHATRGFDWILDRYGICNAITTAGSGEGAHADEVRQHCIRTLVRALYNELRARLTAEIEHRFNIPPDGADAPPDTPGIVRKLIVNRDWLFEDEAYHIDTSHLSSVVQMSMNLSPCPELNLARELCAYGAKLTGRFLGREDPPFDKGYADYEVYLSILAGDDVEAGLKHFREKVETTDVQEYGTFAAEVLVNLLLKLDRGAEAVAVARKYFANPEGRQLTCPGLNELCQRFEDWGTLADVAKEQGDAVHYLAGRIAGRK